MTKFQIYDVFTKTTFSGNPLAIIPDAKITSDAQMLQIAKEFNLSETIFISPKQDGYYTVRIFTPSAELAFAGHPTIGGAIAIARQEVGAEFTGTHKVVFIEKAGLVEINLQLGKQGHDYAEFIAPKIPQEIKIDLTATQAAEILGLTPADIGFAGHNPSLFDCGTRFFAIPIQSRAALRQIKLNATAAQKHIADQPHLAFYCYCAGEAEPVDFSTRMFSIGWGMAEDPATGSAATSFAGVLAKYQDLTDGAHKFVLEQGVDMGRPSEIYLDISMAQGLLNQVKIGGYAAPFSHGNII